MCVASAVVTFDRLMLASVLADGVGGDRFGAMCASLLALSTRAAKEVERGGLRQVILDGRNGPMLLSRAGRVGVSPLPPSPTPNLGRLILKAKTTATALAELYEAPRRMSEQQVVFGERTLTVPRKTSENLLDACLRSGVEIPFFPAVAASAKPAWYAALQAMPSACQRRVDRLCARKATCSPASASPQARSRWPCPIRQIYFTGCMLTIAGSKMTLCFIRLETMRELRCKATTLSLPLPESAALTLEITSATPDSSSLRLSPIAGPRSCCRTGCVTANWAQAEIAGPFDRPQDGPQKRICVS